MSLFSRLNPVRNLISNGASKILAKKKFVLALVFLVVIVGIFAAFSMVGAQEPAPEMRNALSRMISFILQALVSFFGYLLLLEVKILTRIAQYNEFIRSTAVTNGWVIVRDLCNMFFIVVLLAIAIATILKIEMYHYKKLLGRLLIMAILINFSKMICGLVIDFAQVLMLTFVNGFSAAAGGNFVQALKINEIMKIKPGEDVTEWTVLLAYLLALLMTIVSCVVVGVMIAVFLMRIIMLWILIVLSPLAYLLSTFPQGQKYAGQWWSQFGNYVIVGPVLAFFLWLSLLSVSTLSPTDVPPPLSGEEDIESRVAVSEVGGEESIVGFIIAIGMLVGGLVITQQLGVMGSSLAGGAVAGMKKYGMAAVKKPFSFAGKKAGQYYNRGADMMYGKTGIALPGSKLRKEFKEEREKALHLDRRYKGQVVSADRVAGARTGIGMAAATLMDPGLARKMGTLGVLKMVAQREQAVMGMKRYAALQGERASYERMREDPVGLYPQEIGREQKEESEVAKTKGENAKKMRGEHKDKFDQIGSLEGQAKILEDEIGKLPAAADLEGAISALQEAESKAVAERGRLAAELKRVTAARPEDLVKEMPDAEAKIAEEQKRVTERRRRDPKLMEADTRKMRKKGIEPGTPEGDAWLEKEDRRLALGRVSGEYKKSRMKESQTQIERQENQQVEKAKKRQGEEAQLKERKDKEKELGEIQVNLGKLRIDEDVQNTIKLESEAKEHAEKAKELKDISEKIKRKEVSPEKIAKMALARREALYKKTAFANAGLSTSTPGQLANLNRMSAAIKERLTKQLGREPTPAELDAAHGEAERRERL